MDNTPFIDIYLLIVVLNRSKLGPSSTGFYEPDSPELSKLNVSGFYEPDSPEFSELDVPGFHRFADLGHKYDNEPEFR